ncbi:hypothetical protein FQN54_005538 [Arachnomyces sp. PD_36]|nr:hypothetical protein FQN54_005538 [Arachnomyces sp. PD_36]
MSNPVDRLAVKTVLLYLLNDLPSKPTVNTRSWVQETEPDRSLTFKHELVMTQQLAFVSAYSPEPLHVTAICVEEGISRDRLVIRYAVNTGKHEKLHDGLTKIARVLENEAMNVNSSPTHHEALFEALVSLNHRRILSRLRSRHTCSSRTKKKPPILQKLDRARSLLRNSPVDDTRIKGFASDVADLRTEFRCLEEMAPAQARSSNSEHLLRSLVRGIHSFLQRHERDLRLIPSDPANWSGDGDATNSLIRQLNKIGRYVEACEELLRVARRYRRLFSNITIEFVDLQQKGSKLSRESAQDIDGAIDDICTRETISRLSARRHKPVLNTQERIKERLCEKSRLHAEIQLVLFYESYIGSGLIQPRVICSSKSACYLCHLLFKLHGGYHIPSSHGRLYDSWKWPAPTRLGRSGVEVSLDRLLPGFSDEIDRKISNCLNSEGPRRRNEPVESGLDLRAAMTPSVVSFLSRRSGSIRSDATVRQQLGDITEEADTERELIPLCPSQQLAETQMVDSALTVRNLSCSDENDRRGIRSHSSHGHSVNNLLSNNLPSCASSQQLVETQMIDPALAAAMNSTSSGRGATPTIRSRSLHDNNPSYSPHSNNSPPIIIPPPEPRSTSRRGIQAQAPPIHLRKGELALHTFNTENSFLQVHLPDLHLHVEYDPPSLPSDLSEEERLRGVVVPFRIEIEYLPSSSNGSSVQDWIVDLEKEVNCISEKATPEGILFSPEGLLLRHKCTLLRLRAG